MGRVSGDRTQPIAVFDSGLGGLTVLRECLVWLPHEDFVYLGDTARFPYGDRSEDDLRERSLAVALYAGAGKLARDEYGFILSGPDLMRETQKQASLWKWPLEREPFLLETSTPGIFVAGDVRRGSIKRVASGVGEGSIAVQFIHQYLRKL